MPISIENNVITSQAIAPMKPAVMLYISQAGEEIRANLRILAALFRLNPMFRAVIPITGNNSMIRFLKLGSLSKNKKLQR